MPEKHFSHIAPTAQKLTSVIDKPNNHRFLPDGIYLIAGEYVAVIADTEVAWSDNYPEISQSFDQMVAAELCEVFA